MDFSQVDNSFSEWANENSLHIFTEYKGHEVRSVDISDISGTKWQMWLVPVPENYECVIHYWDYKDRSNEVRTTVGELKKTLASIVKKMNE